MSREIKFHGKRIDNGEWIEGLLLTNKLGTYIITEKNPHECTQYGYLEINEYARVDPETVGQYTGLKDRNGIEIYEGDIVRSVALSNDHHQRGAIVVSPVEYWNGNACLSITYTPIYPFCIDHEIEVIGNIYANPELLGEDKHE